MSLLEDFIVLLLALFDNIRHHYPRFKKEYAGMSKEPSMMNQRWEIGVDAAWAANEARDMLIAAEQKQLVFDEVNATVTKNRLPGITVDPDVRSALVTEVTDAGTVNIHCVSHLAG